MNSFYGIQLAQPVWLIAIPLCLMLAIYFTVKSKQGLPPLTSWLNNFSREVYRHPFASRLQLRENVTQPKHVRNAFFSVINYTILISLLSISLAQPYKIGKKLPEPPQHRDIVFLVDTSVSMVLRDYLVNGVRTERISVLKNVLTHFIEQLKGSRIQLIAYSEKAYTLVPLTTDYQLLIHQLQRLDAASLTGRSSDLSNALLYALQHYQQATLQTSDTAGNDNKPVFVMLTDVNRPVRNIHPKIAAEYVAQHGIRLHTIAIGAASYAAEDQAHRSLIYHPTRFNLLKEVADAANGQFFWAKDHNSLAIALSSINEGEKRSGHAEAQYIHLPLYLWPLLLAMGWLTLLYLISFGPRVWAR